MILQIEPHITEEDIRSVEHYMRNGGWLTEFEETQKFEQEVSDTVHVKFCSAVTSGTIGLFLALKACGIKPGDRVLVPDYTMAATANAVYLAGAEPVLVGVDDCLCMNINVLNNIKNTKDYKALIFVSINGRGGNIQKVVEFCKEHGIILIEDACQSFGAQFCGTYLGTLGDIGVYSLSPHKIITTGQGGLIVTNNEEYYNKIEGMKDFCRDKPGSDIHTSIGYNFKFTDLQAVVGRSQLRYLHNRLNMKRKVYSTYKELLGNEHFVHDPNNDCYTPWAMDLVVAGSRHSVCAELARNKIGSRYAYPPLHTQIPWEGCEFLNVSVYEPICNLINSTLWLPSSLTLPLSDIQKTCEVVLKELQRSNT